MFVFLREKNSFLLDMLLGLTLQCTKLHGIVLHMLILPVSSLAQSYPYVWSSLAGRHGHDIHANMN